MKNLSLFDLTIGFYVEFHHWDLSPRSVILHPGLTKPVTDLSPFLIVLISKKCMYSNQFEILEGWKIGGKPIGFVSTIPGTCRSSSCRAMSNKYDSKSNIQKWKRWPCFIWSALLFFFFSNFLNVGIKNFINNAFVLARTYFVHYLHEVFDRQSDYHAHLRHFCRRTCNTHDEISTFQVSSERTIKSSISQHLWAKTW